ncbi:5-bromo-4-chloroindolyl phosphate hydrolysis family protein [Methyloprofundus sp.]|uniref:5-bromo-4-chloroindolyl phosphate hydrolysis family protein n=1 Tax=Methyloprofundus sp. TaxID=2020875 RepID=UPI003D11D820
MNNTEQLRKPKPYQKKNTKGLLHNSRGLLLYILPLPLIPAAILSFVYGDLLRIITNVSGCIAYLLAASLLRRGMLAQKEYQDKKITNAPKWPLKTLAAIIVALTTAGIAFIGAGNSFFVALAFGLGALVGMSLLYGFDPRKEKMIAGFHGYTAEEISATIDDAESQISGIERANKEINNRSFNKRIHTICQHAREILSMLEEDPGDIRRARKFLNTYLDGALKVTQGYADMQSKHATEQLTDNFENVLYTIESVFVEQKQKLLADDVLDLDVQIEVLTAQLKHEGVI